MQEGKNNEKSREGIGKDKPIRQPAAINDGIIIQDHPVLLGQRELRSFTGTGGKLEEESSGE
jgi:hypothetical protein